MSWLVWEEGVISVKVKIIKIDYDQWPLSWDSEQINTLGALLVHIPLPTTGVYQLKNKLMGSFHKNKLLEIR